jgi:hypothetical protein
MEMAVTELHELSIDALDNVAGGENRVIDFGGGNRWVIRTNVDDPSHGDFWVCNPEQCVPTGKW